MKPLINAKLGYGYVEETSHGSIWLTTRFSGTDQEFLDYLKKLFRDYYREEFQNEEAFPQCCLKSKEDTTIKFCPKCGRKLTDCKVTVEETIDEEIGQWFQELVTGTYDSHGDVMAWMEENNVRLWLASDEFPCKHSILYDIGAFDKFLANDNRMVNVERYDISVSKVTEIKLKETEDAQN